MNSNSLYFDTLIYSANFSGVLAALILKSKKKKVLLLNRYGFFGGTVTESLNLYQKKLSSSFENSILAEKILKRIYSDRDGLLFENDTHLIFNPEVVKYILQKICEENEIELLFHITPTEIKFEEDSIRLKVFGREGEINLGCKQIFDFSTETTFAPLIEKTSRSFLGSFVNFITLPVENEFILDDAYQKIKLRDNRWWISIKHINVNLLNVEEISQSDFDRYDEQLRANGSRIQIVPAQSNLIFDFKRTDKFDNRIFLQKDFINSFEPDDELLIAGSTENFLNSII